MQATGTKSRRRTVPERFSFGLALSEMVEISRRSSKSASLNWVGIRVSLGEPSLPGVSFARVSKQLGSMANRMLF